jgi:hypothetical protein
VHHTQEDNLELHIQADSHNSYSTHSQADHDARSEEDQADAAALPSFLLFVPALLQLVQQQLLLLVLTLLLHLAQALPAHLQLLLADRPSPLCKRMLTKQWASAVRRRF